MPKIVDHDLRRADIVRSFLDLASQEGLENVSLRGVASHGDISLRQVQYYFGTKEKLISAGLDTLKQQSDITLNAQWAKTGDVQDALSKLSTLFTVALPTDKASKQFHHLWMSYSLLSLTTQGAVNETLLDGTHQLEALLVAILQEGIDAKTLDPNIHAEHQAKILLGLINGLGSAVLLGQQSESAAMACFQYHLDSLNLKE